MNPGQILLDTYRTQSEQWSWRPAWHVQGESAWTLFWKFAQLNQLTGRELVQLIANRTSGKRTAICAKPDVDLRDASVFDFDILADLFRVERAKMRHAFLFEILPGSVLRSYDHLRWCVQCMGHGFHSPLFQMRLTRSCPIHDQPLLEHCPNCNREIAYRLNTLFLLKPFHCTFCDCDFAPTMATERPDILRLRQEETSRLSLLLKFHRAADVDLVSASDADRLFITAKNAGIYHVSVNEVDVQSHYASFIAQVLDKVAPGILPRQRRLRFRAVTHHVCGCWRPVCWEDDDGLGEDEPNRTSSGPTATTSDMCLATLINTYKAIRRRLWQGVLKKHRHCINFAAAHLREPMRGKKTGGFCPHAMAFIRWRMLWEGCGTPCYLFVKQANNYFGILGWHLGRLSPVPIHWSVQTKAWLAGHIFSSTCLASFNDMSQWASEGSVHDNVVWDLPKGPVDHNYLWAIAGLDCRDQPATVHLRREPVYELEKLSRVELAAHWRRHQVDVIRLQQCSEN
jgi:hypothetical protein